MAVAPVTLIMDCGGLRQSRATEGDLLDLNDLSVGNIPAITPAMGAALAEAAAVCLESQGRRAGVRLSVSGYREGGYTLRWQPVSPQGRDLAYNEAERATETGALSIAILVAQAETGYVVMEPSRRGTGFDYWLGETSGNGIVYTAGLEVSGIRRGDETVIRARVQEKLRQANRRKRERPDLDIYVIVVEFGRPLAEVQRNERNDRSGRIAQ